MIEINLLPGKKKFRLPVVLGIDLNLVNIKWVLVTILIHAIVPSVIQGTWEDEIKILEEKAQLSESEFKKAEKKGAVSGDIQEKIQVLNEQEKKLHEKLTVVKEIIKIKKNPIGIMLYLAKNIPNDLWLLNITLENDNITLEGESNSYKSIGVFIENLQESIFFGSSVKLDDSRTVSGTTSGQRSEQFKIVATIMRYE